MTLKDLLKKKDLIKAHSNPPSDYAPPAPEVTLMRSDTHTQEILTAPTIPDDNELPPPRKSHDRPKTPTSPNSSGKRTSRFRSLSSASFTSSKDPKPGGGERPGSERRLSQLLHLRSSSYSSRHSSVHVPDDLPQIERDGVNEKSEDQEARWEERATLLARENLNLNLRQQGATTTETIGSKAESEGINAPLKRPGSAGNISNAKGDVCTYLRPVYELYRGRDFCGIKVNGAGRMISRRPFGCMRAEVRSPRCSPSHEYALLSPMQDL